MPDPARARRLAKRISTLVASAIEFEIKDPRLAGVTITDAKVTGDLHDATLYYTVFGATLEDEPDYAGEAADRMEDLLARARAADEDLARVRQGAKHAGEEDPYRKGGAEGASVDLDDGLDAEDTGDRNRQDD